MGIIIRYRAVESVEDNGAQLSSWQIAGVLVRVQQERWIHPYINR